MTKDDLISFFKSYAVATTDKKGAESGLSAVFDMAKKLRVSTTAEYSEKVHTFEAESGSSSYTVTSQDSSVTSGSEITLHLSVSFVLSFFFFYFNCCSYIVPLNFCTFVCFL